MRKKYITLLVAFMMFLTIVLSGCTNGNSNTASNTGKDGNTTSTNTQKNQNNSQNNEQIPSQEQVTVSEEEAIKLVLEKVPGATEQNVKIKLEYDDGYYKYDGDIIYEQKEYDFEIDAYSGEFLEWSEEKI